MWIKNMWPSRLWHRKQPLDYSKDRKKVSQRNQKWMFRLVKLPSIKFNYSISWHAQNNWLQLIEKTWLTSHCATLRKGSPGLKVKIWRDFKKKSISLWLLGTRSTRHWHWNLWNANSLFTKKKAKATKINFLKSTKILKKFLFLSFCLIFLFWTNRSIKNKNKEKLIEKLITKTSRDSVRF